MAHSPVHRRLLRRLALERLTGEQWARHAVVVGEPAQFQGDERDVVLLSMVASPKAAPAQVGQAARASAKVAAAASRAAAVGEGSAGTAHPRAPLATSSASQAVEAAGTPLAP
ncbi:MAG: hypothetical protein VX152_12390, partial [Pseudomonadota bacterium]|nr:hypothetical protein [Pseudomonadota bacterium]